MKKLLLTVAVASLALSSTDASANRGNGGRGKEGRTKTEEQRREEQRKAEQAGTAGSAASSAQAQSYANQLIMKTRLVTGSAVKVATDALAKAVTDGILTIKDLETLELNSAKEVAVNYTNLLVTAAMKGQLNRSSESAGVVQFGRIEVLNNLNGKTQWSAEAEAKLNTTLLEATRSLKEGDAVNTLEALKAGLKKAGFDQKRIDEILKECFKIG